MDELALSPAEARLFDLLSAAAQKHGVTARIAGGWVRDKLLGHQSHDVDVAVEGMSGEAFARLVVAEYASWPGAEPHAVGVIQANPEQSKGLETATTQLFDYQVDFAGLRQETYSEASRIPVVVAGTAQEDARRRDFTVNALFYNVNLRKVEDYVGGLADLRGAVLRTPGDPRVAFREDPLRLLRCVRFRAKLGFRVADDIAPCFDDAELVDRLGGVVARSRFAPEVLLGLQYDCAGTVALYGRHPRLLRAVFYDCVVANSSDELRAAYAAAVGSDFAARVQAHFLGAVGDFGGAFGREHAAVVGFCIIAGALDELLGLRGAAVQVAVGGMAAFRNNKQKAIRDRIAYLVPFVSCMQSARLSAQVRTLSLCAAAAGDCALQDDMPSLVYRVHKLQPDRLVCDVIGAAPVFARLRGYVESVYRLKLGVFLVRPCLQFAQAVAALGVTDRRLFGRVQDAVLRYSLEHPEYPECPPLDAARLRALFEAEQPR